MEIWWNSALWRQFGAAIDMLDSALLVCPAAQWTQPLWHDAAATEFPPRFAEFWYVSFHALTWLDLYLAAVPEEEFSPPAPFVQGAIDAAASQPAEPYTKEALRAYLAALRQRCQRALLALTEEQARRPVSHYPWISKQPISYLELQLYSLRHVQEHAAQLSLFLGQHDTPVRWVAQAKGDVGSR